MARISLKEQYDNKDVIQQIYLLRDNFETLEIETDEAVQQAKDAAAAVQQYTIRIDRAETTANEAKTTADNALAGIQGAVDTAGEAKTISQTAFTDFDYSYDNAQVSIRQVRGTGAEVTKALPVASATQSGIMNAQTYQGITNLDTRVTALEGQARTYYVTFASNTPSQSDITSLVTAKKGSAPITGDYAEDIEKNLRYGWDGSQWVLVKGSTSSSFTNTSAGLIKGSTNEGCIFAESDGTGSVVGWDAVKSHATTYGSKVDTLETQMATANGNIATLQNSVATAQSTADSANTLAGQADSKADANAGNITTLQGNVNTCMSDIATLKTSKQKALVGSSVQLPNSGWNTSSKTQTVSVSGVTTTSLLWIGPDGGSWTEYGTCGVRATAQGEGTITFQCDTIPTGILTANIIIA